MPVREALDSDSGFDVDLMSDKDKIIWQVKNSYRKLLPDVLPENVDEAINACYEDGITADELCKSSYAYLHPTKEPSLY